MRKDVNCQQHKDAAATRRLGRSREVQLPSHPVKANVFPLGDGLEIFVIAETSNPVLISIW